MIRLHRVRPELSFIYFIKCQGHTKIGVAQDTKQRLRDLQAGCPFTLTLLAAYPTPTPLQDEQRLHKLLALHVACFSVERLKAPRCERLFLLRCGSDIRAFALPRHTKLDL